MVANAQSGNFLLELNTANNVGDNCRLTFVATNNTGQEISKTSYEVAMFDAESKVTGLLVLEFGALPSDKTKVVQFDLEETDCSDVSRIVVNDVAECEAENGPSDNCMSALITSARTEIRFGL